MRSANNSVPISNSNENGNYNLFKLEHSAHEHRKYVVANTYVGILLWLIWEFSIGRVEMIRCTRQVNYIITKTQNTNGFQ